MTSGQPDGEYVHAAGERDHGIVGESEQDETDAAEVAQAVPDGNCEQKLQMGQQLGFGGVYREGAGLR